MFWLGRTCRQLFFHVLTRRHGKDQFQDDTVEMRGIRVSTWVQRRLDLEKWKEGDHWEACRELIQPGAV